MRPVRDALDSAVRTLVASQPLTDGKVEFAWRLAAGPAMARATTVVLRGTTLRIQVDDQNWRREVRRLVPDLLTRIGNVLGRETVRSLSIVSGSRPRSNG